MTLKQLLFFFLGTSFVFCQNPVASTSSSSILASVPTTQNVTCSICLDDLQSDEIPSVKLFTCSHNEFHVTCILSAIRAKAPGTCPLCRAALTVIPKTRANECITPAIEAEQKVYVLNQFRLGSYSVGARVAYNCRFSNATMLEFFNLLVQANQYDWIQTLFTISYRLIYSGNLDFQVFVPTLNAMNVTTRSKALPWILKRTKDGSRTAQIEYHKNCMLQKDASCNFYLIKWYAYLLEDIEVGTSGLDVSIKAYLDSLKVIKPRLFEAILDCPRTLIDAKSAGNYLVKMLNTKLKSIHIFDSIVRDINRYRNARWTTEITIPAKFMRAALIQTVLKQNSYVLESLLKYTRFNHNDRTFANKRLGQLSVMEKLKVSQVTEKLALLKNYRPNMPNDNDPQILPSNIRIVRED